ncbi:SRPBCC family protein [Pseudonocardia pini]|uniref:SRPBCC family protein n=1 Tax=Pseudonocardia pini TaxID=2758030 RepID=UPI0015F0C11F|nr:SRPBCC family protein [Pseudonocardia pini]
MSRVRVVSLVLVGVLGLGTLGAWSAVQPPAVPPAYDGPRPDPVADGYVSHTESVFVAVSPARYRAWVGGRDLSDVVAPPEGGLAAVVATTPLRGDWDPARDRSGDRRRVTFADGHHLAEEVLVDTPERFRYLIWGFTAPQRFAVAHGTAEFTYTAAPGGMTLSWTYSFLPSNGLVAPFVRGFVADTIAPMMRGTLEGMRVGAERASI